MDQMVIEPGKLFDLCDQDKKGFLVARDLKTVCPQLDDDEINFIFMTLDSDGSGHIDREEFLGGFQNALCRGESHGYPGIKRRASVIEVNRKISTCDSALQSDTVYECEAESNEQSRDRAGQGLLQVKQTMEEEKRLLSDYVQGNDERMRLLEKASSRIMELKRNTSKEYEETGQILGVQIHVDVLANKPISKAREEIYHSDSESNLTIDFNLPCQDEILQFYEQLQSAGMPKALTRFEKIVGNFCKEIKEQRDQNARLQHVFESERESYNRRMNEVESEIDQHIAYTERRAREEERIKLSREKEIMRSQLEGEMAELKANIARMKAKVENAEALRNEPTSEVKHKLQDLSQENQALKSKLAESHFELAVIKSELATVRADYESRKEAMMSDSEALAESARESENLQRQLKLLYDANKRLHDTNDSLRKALDLKTVRAASPSPFSFDASSAEQKRVASPRNNNDEDAGIGVALKHKSSITCHLETAQSATAASPECGPEESIGPPERTFRVVMCGDAAVGKSSIVTRIIKGTFSGNLPSTLGVDFHVKAINIDGKNVAIQLWDTAGQERFRSLCKSYFRRADGAILVYDCAVENSFLNVREWIETIKESTIRQIPIMICANKIDLRATRFSGIVSTEDGEAVAATMGVLFAECSALDGTNVDGALLNLARELMTTEDVEIKGTGVVLMPRDPKKVNTCCSRS